MPKTFDISELKTYHNLSPNESNIIRILPQQVFGSK
jgi:hypothetical protein